MKQLNEITFMIAYYGCGYLPLMCTDPNHAQEALNHRLKYLEYHVYDQANITVDNSNRLASNGL